MDLPPSRAADSGVHRAEISRGEEEPAPAGQQLVRFADEVIWAGDVFDGVPQTHDVDLLACRIKSREIADGDVRSVGSPRTIGRGLRYLDAPRRAVQGLRLIQKEPVRRADLE